MSDRDIGIALEDHLTSANLRTSRREARRLREGLQLVRDIEFRPSPAPIRFIVGTKRPEPLLTMMRSECARIAAVGPEGNSVEVEEAAHSIPQERPGRTAAGIGRFAAELSG